MPSNTVTVITRPCEYQGRFWQRGELVRQHDTAHKLIRLGFAELTTWEAVHHTEEPSEPVADVKSSETIEPASVESEVDATSADTPTPRRRRSSAGRSEES